MAAEDAELIDLEAEVAADTRPTGGCSVCDWVDGRIDAEVWDRMMAASTKKYGHQALLSAMKRRGYTLISPKPIENHRKQGHRGPA
jgi:hypothetical protein